jgi:GntR family transcriptional regulator
MIASGQLKVGAELPSIRDLAVRHAVNPMTISKAYSLLEAEGLLARHRGKPMTVAAASNLQPHPAKPRT